MLNVKRFLRSDPLLPVELAYSRAHAKERWRDRAETRVRSILAPVFNVLTRDLLKEYRIFSKPFYR